MVTIAVLAIQSTITLADCPPREGIAAVTSDWPTSRDFDKVEERCVENLGRTVVSIHSWPQMDQAIEACGEGRACWIGLQQNPNKVSTQWTWSDGSPLDFGFDVEGEPLTGDESPWQSGQPELVAEAGSGDTNCVVLSNQEGLDGKWAVVSCNEISPTNYALCGLCISLDCECEECAVECSGEEFAVWPKLSESEEETTMKPTTTEEPMPTEEDAEVEPTWLFDVDDDDDDEDESEDSSDDVSSDDVSTDQNSKAESSEDDQSSDESSEDQSSREESSEDELEDHEFSPSEAYEEIDEDSDEVDSAESIIGSSEDEKESEDQIDDEDSDKTDSDSDSEEDISEADQNDSKDSKGDDDDGNAEITSSPTSSPTFEIVECIEDKDCDGYRMECNEYAECAQISSDRKDGRDGYPIIGRAAQASDAKSEQMAVFRSRVIYVDDIKAMLTKPMWLSGMLLMLILLVARPMYGCWARREYKRVAPRMDIEYGYHSCV